MVDRKAVEGEVVDTGTMLFDVADMQRMWLTLDVRQEDARYLSLGQRVLFRAERQQGRAGDQRHVAWISTEADDVTRTVKVRVDLPNADGRLAGQHVRHGPDRAARRAEGGRRAERSDPLGRRLQRRVRARQELLRRRRRSSSTSAKVRPGVKDGDTTEIIAGLLPGEVIASKNSVVLEAQLLKSNLGAGCGCCATANEATVQAHRFGRRSSMRSC